MESKITKNIVKILVRKNAAGAKIFYKLEDLGTDETIVKNLKYNRYEIIPNSKLIKNSLGDHEIAFNEFINGKVEIVDKTLINKTIFIYKNSHNEKRVFFYPTGSTPEIIDAWDNTHDQKVYGVLHQYVKKVSDCFADDFYNTVIGLNKPISITTN